MIKKIIPILLAICLAIPAPLFSGVSTGRPLFIAENIPTNMVGYWKLNNSLSDSSGNGLTLLNNNLTPFVQTDYWSTGEYSANLQASSSQYFYGTDSLDMNGKSFTLRAKVKLASLSGVQCIFSKGNNTNGYSWEVDASGYVHLHAEGLDASTNSTISANKWYDLAVTFDWTTGTYNHYINGNIDRSGIGEGTITATALTLKIGALYGGTPHYFNGIIKDVVVWEGVLTPIQIKSLALAQDLTKNTYRPNKVSTQSTAWWKLNELYGAGSGTRADSIGALTLTDNGGVPSAGGYFEGSTANFDGSADYLSIADNTAFDFSGGVWSMAGWFYIDTIDANSRRIFFQETDATNYFDLSTTTDDAYSVNFAAYIGGAGVTFGSVGGVALGKWVHIAITENGDTWKMYVNGVDRSASVTNPTNRCGNYTGNFQIGYGENTSYFDGRMADFAIWKGYTLTAAEVGKLARGLDVNTQGLVSYWKMDAASGTEIDIISGKNLSENGGTVGTGTGVVGAARDFEKDDSRFLDVGTDSVFEPNEFSIFEWYKPESVGISLYHFFHMGGSSGYYTSTQTDNKLTLATGSDEGVKSSSTVAAATWAHFGAMYDGNARNVYFNGKYENGGAATYTPGGSATVQVGLYADGLVDEILFFKRAVFPEESTAIYIKGLNGKETTDSDSGNTGSFFNVM